MKVSTSRYGCVSRGRFITIEGGEGAGKSTQAERLCDALRAHGIAAVCTREPGGSPGAEEIRAFRRDEALALADDIDYGAVGGLSSEVREKLSLTRPATLGAAARIPGVTPAALTALLRYVWGGEQRRCA